MRKIFSLFAALTLSVGLWAETATNVPYIDANGNPQVCPEATVIEGSKSRSASLAAGWYVVPNTGTQIRYWYDVICNGAVHLILADGCDLWVEEGIQVAGLGKSLTIYGQSAQTGQLKADGGTYKPGIGTDAYAAGGYIGQITINGGHITATGNADCAGIGGGWYMPGSNITINGGYVTAIGGSDAPGIGSGVDGGNASSIFISSNCVVKAGSSDILTDDDLVEHTSSEDIASKLAGKQYVLAMEVIVPKIASITSNPTTPNAGHEVAFSATVANFSGVPTYSYEVKKEGGSYAAIQDGKFLPTMSGNYTVKVTATYSNEVAYKEQAFTVASPEVGDSIFYDNVYYTVTSTNPSYTVEVGKNGGRFLGESVFIPTAVPCDGHDFVVTALGEGAFVSCSLDSLEIPASITYFGKDVFLQTYLFNFFVAWTDPSQLPTIHEDAFMIIFEYNNCTLYVPFGTRKMYEEDHFWKSFGVTKERVEPYHRIRQNGIVYEVLTVGETNTVKVVADEPIYSNTSYTLPTTITYDDVVYTVTEIGDNAFKNCSNVAEVTVAWTENLPTLGTDAFAGIAPGAILHVPAGTKALYEADGWDAYFTITEPGPTPVPTTYIDENGVEQNIDAWEVKDASAAVTWGTADETTWYVVKGTNVQLSKGAICAGDVRLILADGAKLTAEGGGAGIAVTGTNSLTIYGQSTGDQMGQLEATGGMFAAGIGGGRLHEDGSNITINGGKVTAIGEGGGAGIGGGDGIGWGTNIIINGGIVIAQGASGIGGGSDASGSDIYISDAYVLKAGADADNTEVIAHSSATDLGSTLKGKGYVKIEGLATPYTRTTSVDQWATVCLPYDATSFSGADFYKVNYYDGVDKLYIEPVDNLVAGMPYIFHTTADVVTIEHNATAPEAVTAGNEYGLYGSFARKTIAYDADHAFAALANNTVNVIEAGHTVTVPACRAYFDMDDVPDSEQSHSAPLRCIGVPRQTPTSLDKTLDTKHQTQKLLHNGQFVIIRDGKTYNAQGQIIQ